MENQQIGPQAEPKDKMLEDSKVCMNSRWRKLTLELHFVKSKWSNSEQQFTTSSSHIIQKGITLTAFSGMTGKGKPSIIGSGATDHMIEYKKLFTLYVPSPQNHRVKIVDRTRFREGRLAMLRISKGYTTSRRTFLCVVEFKLLCAILP
ncbi:hypothetical protein CK203_106325 [Vitis vinifera]|uniref:Uncharacterized protein n=1 Tax=Vitis vinifera TaxID=29760 RepID=A0A438CDU1_VITVI|nr:hypothetical protein CK203_106325 [Vitis vinifera]